MSQSNSKTAVKVDRELKDLMPDFLKRRVEDVVAIFYALEEGNFETIEAVGHQIKGSGTAYGLPELTAIGALLEIEARGQNKEAIASLAKQISDYLDTLEITFK